MIEAVVAAGRQENDLLRIGTQLEELAGRADDFDRLRDLFDVRNTHRR